MTGLQKAIRAAKHGAHDWAAYLNYGLANYSAGPRRPVMETIRSIKRGRAMATSPLDAYQLFAAARATAKVKGEAAEAGVFQGATAKLILDALPDKTLHLFDTFEGLPNSQDGYDQGQYRGGLDDVRAYLGSDRVRYHKGYFPTDTGHEVASERFAFVHLDLDYYDGTLAALEFFWPRMPAGGMVLTHDYISLPGPTKAFNTFFQDRPEPVVELSGIQALVVKLA